MYCVNCGVKLADSEKTCPLCGTKVFHPDITQEQGSRLYPATGPGERVDTKAVQTLLTILFLLPVLLVFLCDRQINGEITWSGYVMGAIGLGYIVLILPSWFKKPNPVIFTPCGFAALALFLLYINLKTGGNWFLTFAFPVTGGLCLIVTAVVTLMRYVPKGALYIFGGAIIALGVFMVLVEYLLDVTFQIPKFFGWSFYPLVILGLLGGYLIYLAISRPAREMMERKFFI